METIDLAISIDHKLPKYHQFTNLLLNKIHNGELKEGEKLPSIVDASESYELSRDTVLRAYKDLYNKGLLTSVYRKGYFVSNPVLGKPTKRVLMITSGLTSANFLFYQKLSRIMEDNDIEYDFKVYHNNMDRLSYLMDEAVGNYHTFIVDPQLLSTEKVVEIVKSKVVKDEIILLNDQNTGGLLCKRHIQFDIKNDLYTALIKLSERLDHYQTLNLMLPEKEYFPYRLINGFFDYCDNHNKSGHLLEEVKGVKRGNAYIAIDEKSLFAVLNSACQSSIEPGEDIGLLALFERPYFQYLSKKITSLNWFNNNLMECIVSAVKSDTPTLLQAEVELNLRESL